MEKKIKRKNSARFFKICKYSFLIFEKGDQRKSCVSFCKYAFSIFEKRGYTKKNAWGFVNIFF